MEVLGDRYAIDGALYESKHTVVLRARDTLLDRVVAIKAPATDDAASLATTEAVFAREAKALAMLEHPGSSRSTTTIPSAASRPWCCAT